MSLFWQILLILVFSSTNALRPLSLGVDIGTSGMRICVIDGIDKTVKHSNSKRWMNDEEMKSPEAWIRSFSSFVQQIPLRDRGQIQRICISGTSSTALLYDTSDKSISRNTRMYNFDVLQNDIFQRDGLAGGAVMSAIKSFAPPNSPTLSSSSTLAKLLLWFVEGNIKSSEKLIHQADFVANYLTNTLHDPTSDWHNALKLGYCVQELAYPIWIKKLFRNVKMNESVLPKVVEPGSILGRIDETLASELKLSKNCLIVAGTTDSIASFLASGVTEEGQAVTTLGSTLVLKTLSSRPIYDTSRGIYSHRLGNSWLVGGASNVGCAIFRDESFSDEEINNLTFEMDINNSPFRLYYPLRKVGERFPTNDPEKLPVLEPKPIDENGNLDRKRYLYALFHSIAAIEKEGYELLRSLGVTPIREVLTTGGGSNNKKWNKIRSNYLQLPVKKAVQSEASYGSALLGCKTLS